MTVIETVNLTKRFEAAAAVSALDLQVREGEVLGLLGPNGAGKTTTVRMIAGMIRSSEGYAVLDGVRTDEHPERVHGNIGLLTEVPGFYERLTAADNLSYFARFYPGVDAGKQIEKYLKPVGLWERRKERVGRYSKGMKQKLALVRALLHEPKVLFLDEPTSGLDPQARIEVRNIIRQLRSERRTILLCTHTLEEAEQVCDRIAVIKNSLIALDTPERLRRALFTRQFVLQLDTPGPDVLERISRLPFVRHFEYDKSRCVIELADPDGDSVPDLVAAAVNAGGRVRSLSEMEHTLEDVYLNLVGDDNGTDAPAGRRP